MPVCGGFDYFGDFGYFGRFSVYGVCVVFIGWGLVFVLFWVLLVCGILVVAVSVGVLEFVFWCFALWICFDFLDLRFASRVYIGVYIVCYFLFGFRCDF